QAHGSEVRYRNRRTRSASTGDEDDPHAEHGSEDRDRHTGPDRALRGPGRGDGDLARSVRGDAPAVGVPVDEGVLPVLPTGDPESPTVLETLTEHETERFTVGPYSGLYLRPILSHPHEFGPGGDRWGSDRVRAGRRAPRIGSEQERVDVED